MSKTFQDQVSGFPFKVISEYSGHIVGEYARLDEAQKRADAEHDATDHHFRVVEIVWCGGSKRLSDLDRRVEAIKRGDITEGPAIVKRIEAVRVKLR